MFIWLSKFNLIQIDNIFVLDVHKIWNTIYKNTETNFCQMDIFYLYDKAWAWQKIKPVYEDQNKLFVFG